MFLLLIVYIIIISFLGNPKPGQGLEVGIIS